MVLGTFMDLEIKALMDEKNVFMSVSVSED